MHLSAAQKEAVEFLGAPQIILAGAGSGKTRVIVAKARFLIEEKGFAPESLLVITYSTKTQVELEDRMADLGKSAPEVRTFHSFGMDIINEFGHLIGMGGEVVKASEYRLWQILKTGISKLQESMLLDTSQPERVYSDIKSFIERAKDELVTPAEVIEFAQQKLNEIPPNSDSDDDLVASDRWGKILEAGKVYENYEKIKSETGGIIDYTDMIFLAHRLLKDHKTVGASLRQKYKYILVDEFQDANYAQVELLYYLSGGKTGVTVVGDDDQAIYRFRGASFGSFLLFHKLFPGNKPFRLEHNYRSTKNIVTAAQALIETEPEARFDPKKRMTADEAEADKVAVRICPDDHTEAESVAVEIESLLRDDNLKSPSSIAVLFRNRNQKDFLVGALQRRGIGFSYDKILEEQPSRPAATLQTLYEFIVDPGRGDILNVLLGDFIPGLSPQTEREIGYRLSRESGAPLNILLAFASELDPDQAETTRQFVEFMVELISFKKEKNPLQLLEIIIERSGIMSKLVSGGKVTDQKAAREIAEILRAADVFSAETAGGSHAEFIEYLEWYKATGDEESVSLLEKADAPVVLQTIHGSKGLEYPVVFAIGLADRRFPGSSRRTSVEFPEDLYKDELPKGDFRLQEERRLLYVAMTRGEKKLYLYGVDKKRSPVSRFVKELETSDQFDSACIREDVPAAELLAEKRGAAIDIKRSPGAVIIPINDDARATLAPAILKTWDAMKTRAETQEEFEKLKSDFMAGLVDLPVILWERITEEEFRKPESPPGAPFESLSYTDINSFDTCPLQFYFGKVLRAPSPPSPAMIFGSAVHNVLEEAGKSLMAGEKITLEKLVSNFDERWRRTRLADPDRKERLGQRAAALFGNFLSAQSLLDGTPKEVEKRFEFEVANIKVTGKIDRIDNTPDGYEIIDYKTGKLDKAKLKSDFQLPIYSLACKELYGEFPSKVTYLFLTETEPYSQAQSPDNLKKIKDNLTEKIEEIKGSDYTADPESFKCSHCGYDRICPARV
ncbi:MAG: ATP-dependent helicase [Candidatus Zixiibacteriota bacterium]|nr:MAG: ATP-dependent helicase [candidate division Zixibacteria bacterium]